MGARMAASVTVAVLLLLAVASAASVGAYYLTRAGPSGAGANTDSSGSNQQLKSALADLVSAPSDSSPAGRASGNQSGSAQTPSYSTPAPARVYATAVQDIPSSKEVDLTVVQGTGYNHSYFVSPITVVIGVNNTVVWINTDASWHSVRSLNGTFNSGSIWTDNEFSYTFTKVGTYPYVCDYHPNMRGTIIVKG